MAPSTSSLSLMLLLSLGLVLCGKTFALPPYDVMGKVASGLPPYDVKGKVASGLPPYDVMGLPPYDVKEKVTSGLPPYDVKGKVASGLPPYDVMGKVPLNKGEKVTNKGLVAVAPTQGPALAPMGTDPLNKGENVTNNTTSTTGSFAQEMVSAHNAVRKPMGLGPLTWNATIAKYAENYAKQRSGDCQMIHSHGQYGENIYWAVGGDMENAAASVKEWVDEKKDYDYAANTCTSGQQCGHYTQVVWKNSQRLGCALVKCSGGNGGSFVTCNYDPPGNYIGQKPY